jgi:hypothetical protein
MRCRGGGNVAAKFTTEQVQERIEAGADNRERKYEIVRFFHPSQHRQPRRVNGANCLTEAEAQAHCHRADTRKDGVYFDGYQKMKGFA